MPISYRVHAIKVGFPDRTITIADDGSEVSCDCDGFNDTFRYSAVKFCSHIDATLIANERAMVPPEDWETVERALRQIRIKLAPPSEWKASWRKNLKWRGLSRQGAVVNPRDTSKPLVCFTGTLPGKTRKEWIEEARELGWETTNEPSRFTDVLVAGDPSAASAKLKVARKFSTAIVTSEEWLSLMNDGVLPLTDRSDDGNEGDADE